MFISVTARPIPLLAPAIARFVFLPVLTARRAASLPLRSARPARSNASLAFILSTTRSLILHVLPGELIQVLFQALDLPGQPLLILCVLRGQPLDLLAQLPSDPSRIARRSLSTRPSNRCSSSVIDLLQPRFDTGDLGGFVRNGLFVCGSTAAPPARAPLDPHGCSARSAPRAPPHAMARRARPGIAPAPKWTPGWRLRSAARSTWPRSMASARCAARLRWSIRSDRPARSSAVLAAVSHAFRVFPSHSLFMNERVFSAPPCSGVCLIGPLEPLLGIPVVTIEATFGDHQVERGDSPRRRDGSPACKAIVPPR